MRGLIVSLLILLLSPTLLVAQQLSGRVAWIYDGDTLLVDDIGKVRLLGIDTPETERSARDQFYIDKFAIPAKHLRQVARDAKQYAIKTVKGQLVKLQTEQITRDKYGRLLAYVQLADGQLLNRLLLEKGLAAVFRRYDFQRKEDFLAAERSARQQQLGLWQK